MLVCVIVVCVAEVVGVENFHLRVVLHTTTEALQWLEQVSTSGHLAPQTITIGTRTETKPPSNKKDTVQYI